MIFIKNMKRLQSKWPMAAKYIEEHQDQLGMNRYRIEPSKVEDHPTIVDIENRYLHSKYNPANEAEMLLRKYPVTSDHSHVLFVGYGMGYHIDLFAEQYPEMSFSVIEPEPQILFQAFQARELTTSDRFRNFILWQDEESFVRQLFDFTQGIHGDVLIIPHPGYARMFPDKLKKFEQYFNELLEQTRFRLRALQGFQRAWIYNSLLNFSKVIATQNIIEKTEFFENKPIIIASAGPSLRDEIDHLKVIQQNRSAYIFSVGSAIHALLKAGIRPDAAVTYDPMKPNYEVFRNIIDQQIVDIPLIFASTTYFEVVDKYPGPMFHYLQQNDSITPLLLSQSIQTYDATSIAVITVQLAHLLKASHIYLVGQNLAYLGEQYYADGIAYGGHLRKDQQELIAVKDVHGRDIYTNSGFLKMKQDMEKMIAAFSISNITNCTKGGAQIEGAPYRELSEVMNAELQAVNLIDSEWAEKYPKTTGQPCNLEPLRISQDEWVRIVERLQKYLQDMNGTKVNQIDSLLKKYDHQWQRLHNNLYFNHVVKPLSSAQYEVLSRKLNQQDSQADQSERLQSFVKMMKHYIEYMQQEHQEVSPIIKAVEQRLNQGQLR